MLEDFRTQGLPLLLLSLAVLFGVALGYAFYLFCLGYYGRFNIVDQLVMLDWLLPLS